MNVIAAKAPLSLSLRKKLSWNLTSQIVYGACQWGMLIVLARLANPQLLGVFALGLGVAIPFFSLSSYWNLQPQELREGKVPPLRGFLAITLLFSAIILLIYVALAWLGGFSLEILGLWLIIGFAKTLEALSENLYGFIEIKGSASAVTGSRFLKGPLGLIAFGLGFVLTGQILWGALAWAGVLGAFLWGYELHKVKGWKNHTHHNIFKSGKEEGTSLSPDWIWGHLKPVLLHPLGMILFFSALVTVVPFFCLAFTHGFEPAGIFAALAFWIFGASRLLDWGRYSASPVLKKLVQEGDRENYLAKLLKWSGTAFMGGIIAVLAASILGTSILTFLYGEEYAKFVDVFAWLTAAAGLFLVNSFFCMGVTAVRGLRSKVKINLFALFLTIFLSWALVSNMGMAGAAWALFLTALILQPINIIALERSARRVGSA